MAESRIKRWRLAVFRWLLVALSALAAAALGEVLLRATRDPGRFFPYYPNTVGITYPTPEITRGVSDPAYFSTNSFGCRGPELAGESHRLLVIGGSTAACTALDDSEAWPQLVMERVNEHYGRADYLWVTNSGMDGRNTRNHIMHAKYLVPKIPDLDHVLVYCGYNDVGMWLFQSDFDPRYLERQENVEETLAKSFLLSNYTAEGAPWFKRLEIWKRMSVLKRAYQTRRMAQRRDEHAIVEDERLQWLKEARERRMRQDIRTPSREKMATFPRSLDAYAANLTTIIRLIRDASSEPILMAQAMQFDALTEQQRQEWWLGAMDGGKSYAEMTDLQEFVRKYNDRMEQIARQEHTLFIPLPELLENQGDLFYDGIHFHEEGAQKVASAVADYLIDNVYDRPTVTTAKQ